MMNNNNDNNEDNRIELIGLNEFIQDDKDNIEFEWGVDEDERPFPDSDEAIRALQDVAEAVEELEAECYRLRAELKTSNADRDEAKRTITRMRDGYEGCCPLCEAVGILNVKLLAERDAALAVVNEFVSDTTTNNETPDHECEFSHSPETGKCDACEAWGNYVGLFCSRTDEEETQ